MLRTVNLLEGTPLHGPDGEAGTLDTVLFDHEQWVVRYLVVNLHDGPAGHPVLVSPYGVAPPDPDTREFRLLVTREQLKRAPAFDSGSPVTRDYERGYLRFFAWPLYWGGGGAGGYWGAGNHPGLLVAAPTASDPAPDDGEGAQPDFEEPDPTTHLHSARRLKGHVVTARDGTEVGEIDDFAVDDQTWALAYVAVHSPGWLGGKRILVPGMSFRDAGIAEGRIDLPLDPDLLRSAPTWEPLEDITADYRARLAKHYGRPDAAEDTEEWVGEEAAHAA